jgi:Ca2+-binding RTX toxin-like protein
VDPTGSSGFTDVNDAVQAATLPGDTIVFATPPASVDIAVNTDQDLDFDIPYDVPTTVTLTGTGSAHVTTGAGDDFVVTSSGSDTIHTGDGNDLVQAGGGDDMIIGGQGGGDDIYDGGSGSNTVSYPSAINPVTIDLDATDRSAQSTLGGTTIGTLLDTAASPYDPHLAVGYAQGIDIGTDVLINIQNATGGAGDDTIIGDALANVLSGGGGNDAIDGGAGNDVIDGGTGNDSMTGGAGDDTYVVDSLGDTVFENPNEGTDTVQSSVTYTLGANVENLTGSGNINGTGNSDNNILTGNGAANTLTGLGGNDTLDGGLGADTMIGGLGNDTYVVDNPGDSVVENAGEGTDTVQSSISYVLSANVEDLTLTGSGNINGTGNSDNNILTGNSGANTLDGGLGADGMGGGQGDDTYYVDNLGDAVYENANEGTDVVLASVSGYTLSANVEIGAVITTTGLILTGNDLDNTLFGNNGDDVLIGGAGSDAFAAGAGNDVIDGGTGNDGMAGGLGNDTYFVDSLGDAVYENPNEGTDTVRVNVSGYTLSANVEIGAVNTATGLTLYGNNQGDALFGNNGDDVLIGGSGNDQFSAGLGNDLDNTLFGNSGNDVLNGGAGNDSFNSGAGNDIINGGVGNDAMTGGAGDDTFVFRLGDGFDQVTDFTAGDSSGDLIALTGYGVASFAQLQAFMSQDGSDVKIAFDSNNQITLQGVTLGQLNQNDFQLA